MRNGDRGGNQTEEDVGELHGDRWCSCEYVVMVGVVVDRFGRECGEREESLEHEIWTMEYEECCKGEELTVRV